MLELKIKTEYSDLGGHMIHLAHSMTKLCQGRQFGMAFQCMIVLEKKLYL